MNTTTKNRPSRAGSARTGQKRTHYKSRPHRGGSNSSRPPYRGGGQNRSKSTNRGRGGKKMPTFNPSQFINTNPVKEVKETFTPKHTFKTFGLDGRLVSTITKMGLVSPTPIQDKIIPEILNGNDVIGLAETGTGKTAAFLIPLIERNLKKKNQQTLILAPTRELAIQISEELSGLARGLHIYSVVCVGGVNIRPQIRQLHKKNQFVIGTPGRVLDLINKNHFKPQNITSVVLDEADRMLDMGFIGDIRTILSATPKDRNTLFFSATMADDAKKLVHDFLRNPVEISVKKKDTTDSIEQGVIKYKNHTKFDSLYELLSTDEFKKVIVFGAMKHSVEKLAKQLSGAGIQAESIHGNKSHGQRQRALGNFKNNRTKVLVATDVAARGIHVDNVSHVINYDLPNTFEDYVHRIGRTGRANKRGKALTFVPESTGDRR